MLEISSTKTATVYSELRQEIETGRWPVGGKIPAEKELAARFACSSGTISKALALLVHEGMIQRRARAGTTVIAANAEGGGETGDPITQLDAFAIIYPSEQHDGIWRTVKGIQDAARESQRRVVMLTTGLNYQKEAEFIARLSEFDVKGAIIYPIIKNPQELVHFSQVLAASKFPVVLAELNLPGLGCSSVVVDGFHAGYTMTRHMISRGAKRIGFFSNFAWAPFMRDRHQGYRWALEETGIEEPSGGVYLDSSMSPDFLNPLVEPTAMAEAFLEKAGKLDAVVCGDDFLALGCIAAATHRGWKVPDDLLVSGINDYSNMAKCSGIPLTTYHVPYEEIGRQAFLRLDGVVKSESRSCQEIQTRGEIILRESA